MYIYIVNKLQTNKTIFNKTKTNMKKTIMMLAAIIAFAGLTATAQKSSKYLIGSVSYTKSTDVKASYSINPLVGYFVTDKVAVGVLGSFGETATETTTNVGVFGRCHFLTIGQHCQVFSQVELISKSSTVADIKITSVAAGFGLGANYSITKKLGLTMHVADLISYETADGNSTTTIGFTGVTNPFAVAKFGVIYKF
jgi:outer membrane protein